MHLVRETVNNLCFEYGEKTSTERDTPQEMKKKKMLNTKVQKLDRKESREG